MRLTIDEFRTRADTYTKSAFRLETLQTFTVQGEQEPLARFLAGEDMPADYNARSHQRLRERVARGMTLTKVKLIRRPLTDYQRFSLAWGIPGNEAAGMQHRIIDVTDREVDLPEIDFWLYDDSEVVVLVYDEKGVPRFADLIAGDIGQYRRWRDIALRESIPFGEYRP